MDPPMTHEPRARRAIVMLAASAVLLGTIAMATAGIANEGSGRSSSRAPSRVPDIETWTAQGADTVRGVNITAVIAAIQHCVAGVRPPHLPVAHWEHIQRLYAAYGDTALWFVPGGLNEPRVRGLLMALIDASADGLRLEEYGVTDIARAVTSIRQATRPTADEIAAVDVLLTTAYVALASDLLSGQLDPRTLAQAWHVHLGHERLDSAVARSLRDQHVDSALARMRPSDENYAALRRELVTLRATVARGGWRTVPAGRTLKTGELESAVRLAVVRQRLAADGIDAGPPVPSAGAPTVMTSVIPMETYGTDLASAVARFQARYGLVVDGALGKATVAALNVPAAYRLGQVAANLERYRWLPHALGERYVLVNVPAFRLEAWDSSGKALEMKVIVGQEYEGRRTPVFADSMEYVVFRPYWLVPPSIQARELAPRIARDPGIMARENYEYYRENGRARIRQRPGETNALGLLKFIFPNDFNIYLHDTPQDELFTKDIRAFSHGCIRLEKPELLAQWVLGWPQDRVRDAVHGPDDTRVTLATKIPVYIAYFTTYVRDNVLYFGNDLYSRDAALVKAVAPGALPSADARHALDALRAVATAAP